MNRIVTCNLFQNDQEIIQVDTLDFVESKGIVGDRTYGSGKRQVVLADQRSLVLKSKDGVCFARFKANIILDELHASDFPPGTIIALGSALLKITGHKSCFSDACKLAKSRERCPLKASVLFADVIESGTVKLADELKKEKR